jgi:hypothetical protein
MEEDYDYVIFKMALMSAVSDESLGRHEKLYLINKYVLT